MKLAHMQMFFDFAKQAPLMEQQLLMQHTSQNLIIVHELMEKQRHIMGAELERQYQGGISQQLAEKADEKGQGIVHSKKNKTITAEGSSTEVVKTSSFSILYYNPVTKKTEVIHKKKEIRFNTAPEKAVEKSLGEKSTYGVYSYIAEPILTTKVNYELLKEIRERIEVKGPDKFGDSAIVKHEPLKTIERQIEREVKARRAEIITNVRMVNIADIRKKEIEKQLTKEIIVVENAIEELKKGEKVEAVIKNLPALSKARSQALIIGEKKKTVKKKKEKEEKETVKKILLEMFEMDLGFLKAVKRKLKKFPLKELLEIGGKLKKISK